MRIGAHVSSDGGLANAIVRAVAIGAECAQFFISPPQAWRSPVHDEADVAAFLAKRAESGVAPLFLHTIYLLNFASGDEALRERSLRSLITYLDWADRLGVAGVITHLGSARDVGVQEAERLIAGALQRALATAHGDVPLLLETTAGPGAVFGSTFEELGALLADLGRPPRLRICLDTAHVYASGLYDGTTAGLERSLAALDATVGLERLTAIHLNDSKAAFNSRVDRHANLGEGLMGAAGLRPFLEHPALADQPFILEVPGRNRSGPQKQDLDVAKALARGDGSRSPRRHGDQRGTNRR